MKLNLINIGIIREGEIKLDGLTVIASENDSGKSTVGKILYLLIDTINTFEKKYIESVDKNFSAHIYNIKKIFKPAFRDPFKELFLAPEKKKDNYDFLESDLNLIKEEILGNVLKNISSEGQVRIEFSNLEIQIRKSVKKFIEREKFDFSKNTENLFERVLKDLNDSYDANNDFDYVKKLIFTRELKNELETGIGNLYSKEKKSEIVLEDMINGCHIKIESENVIECKLPPQNLRLDEYKTNLVYLESPIVFDYIKSIKFSDEKTSARVDRLYDVLLEEKAFDMVDEIINKRQYDNLIKNIQEIISGDLEYNPEEYNYVYKKNDKKIKIENTAMGVKTFGIIQVLLRTRELNKNTLLIIDEPEVHLHPKWQIRYAKIIAILVKELGIKVLLNSHSPFFIEAIEKYSAKFDLQDKTNFYTVIKKDSGEFSTIKNVNSSLEDIYKLQAEAYDELDRDTIGDL